jgi:hypothetical protein
VDGTGLGLCLMVGTMLMVLNPHIPLLELFNKSLVAAFNKKLCFVNQLDYILYVV